MPVLDGTGRCAPQSSQVACHAETHPLHGVSTRFPADAVGPWRVRSTVTSWPRTLRFVLEDWLGYGTDPPCTERKNRWHREADQHEVDRRSGVEAQ